MDLVYSLLVMIRAHEESDTKSKRVKAAIRRQCEGWINGTYKGLIVNGKDPSWVKLVDGKFELVPERAASMRAAIQFYKDGHGTTKIAQMLAERGFELYKNRTRINTLYRVFKNPILCGTKVLELDGVEYHLKNYYPALMTPEEFAEFTITNQLRARRKGKGDLPGIVTGIKRLYCGYCGGAVVGQNLTQRAKEDGTLLPGHRRMICSNYADNCPCTRSASVVPVETALLDFCSDQFNLSALLQRNDQTKQLNEDLTTTRQKIIDLQKRMDTLVKAMSENDGEGATLLPLVRKVREMDTELASLQEKEKQLGIQLWKAGTEQKDDDAALWASLREGVLKLDYDARMKARRLVEDTFERIVVWPASIDLDSDASKTAIDLLLISKTGVTRMLRIARHTGKLIHGEETTSAI